MNPNSKPRLFLTLCGGALLTVSSAHAAIRTWDSTAGGVINDGGGAWLNAGQWNTAGTPSTDWISGDDAIFGNGGGGGNVTLASPTSVGSFTFNTFTGTYQLGTTGQTITLNNGITKNAGSAAVTFLSPITLGAAQTWTNNSTGLLKTGNGTLLTNGGFQLTIDGTGNTELGQVNVLTPTLSGSGALVKNGTGTLFIGGDNSAGFSGDVTLNNGMLNYGDYPTSLGTGNLLITNGILQSRWNNGKTWVQGIGAGEIQITGGESGFASGNNAIFDIGAVTWGSSTFNPTKFAFNHATSASGASVRFSSAINLNGATRIITVDGGVGGTARAELSGAISNSTGTAGLTKEGSGALLITNATSAWNGATTVSGGMLDLGAMTNANIGGGSGRNISVAAGAAVRFNNLSNAFLNRIVQTSDEFAVMTGSTSNALDFSSATGANLSNAFLSAYLSNGGKTEISGILTFGNGNYRLGYAGQSGVLGIRQESLLSGTNGLIVGGNRVEIVGAHTFTGDTVIRDGARLGLSGLNTDAVGVRNHSLGLQNSVLDLGASTATGQIFLEAGVGNVTGVTTSANGGTTSATFGGLKGSRDLNSAFLFTNPGNNTSAAVATAITGFTLNVGTGNTVTYSGAIGGFGAGAVGATGGAMTLTKTGLGTQVLSGTSSYTGATTVSGGTLVVNGDISTSTLTTVESGGTIGGSGTVGALTVSTGGFINPGNSPGILSTGDYTQAGLYTAEINNTTAGSGHDQINVTGTVDITGGSLSTLFTGSYAANNLIFILLNNEVDAITGTYAGLADGATVTTYDGFNWNISYFADSGTSSFTGGNDIALIATVIPEPGVALLGGLSLLALLLRRRR